MGARVSDDSSACHSHRPNYFVASVAMRSRVRSGSRHLNPLRSPEEQLVLPSSYVSRSGLILPTSIRLDSGEYEFDELPPDLRPIAKPIAITRSSVSDAYPIMSYVSEAELGFPGQTPMAEMFHRCTCVGFNKGAGGLATLIAKVGAGPTNVAHQLEISALVFGPSSLIHKQMTEAVRDTRLRVPFSEQSLIALLKLMLFASPEDRIDSAPTTSENLNMKLAIVGSTSLGEPPTRSAKPTSEELLSILVQTSEHSAAVEVASELSRQLALLDLARSPEAKKFDSYCPLDQWSVEDYGLTPEEILRLGLVFVARLRAFDGPDTAGDNIRIPAHDVAALIRSAGLSDKADAAKRVISANRFELRDEFWRCDPNWDNFRWELRPLKARPLLRLADGSLLLMAPRFLHSWLTDGFFHRLLTSASRRGKRESHDLTAFYGRLLESLFQRNAESWFGKHGGNKVHPARPFKSGKGDEPDISIEHDLDLVVIEITHSALSGTGLAEGGDLLLRDIHRAVRSKINQLGRAIARIRNGDAHYPALDRRESRIWPILVTKGLPMQTPLLWDFLKEDLSDVYSEEGVQPLTLLSPSEFEALGAWVERGRSLVGILERKTSSYFREMDLTRWQSLDVGAPSTPNRPSSVDSRFETAFHSVVNDLRPYLDQ